MKKFKGHHRIVVSHGELIGCKGTIRRLRIGDNGAWVEMDEIPKGKGSLFPFRLEEGDDRQKHTVLYPEDCEMLKDKLS